MTTVEEQYDINNNIDIYENLIENTTKYTIMEEIQILYKINKIQGVSKARSDRIVELMYLYSKSRAQIGRKAFIILNYSV